MTFVKVASLEDSFRKSIRVRCFNLQTQSFDCTDGVHVVGAFFPVENGTVTDWQPIEDISVGVFRRRTVTRKSSIGELCVCAGERDILKIYIKFATQHSICKWWGRREASPCVGHSLKNLGPLRKIVSRLVSQAGYAPTDTAYHLVP